MWRFPLAACLALCVLVSFAAPSEAQRFDPRADATNLKGKTYPLDAEFSARSGKAVAQPFVVIVPKSPEGTYVARVEEAPASGLVSFNFTGAGGTLLDAVSISAGNSPPIADTTVRLERLAAKMQQVVFPLIQARDSAAEAPRIRPVSVAGLNAVELYGDYSHPTHGPLRWRLVGLPHPEKSATVIALAQMSLDRVVLESVEDMGLTPSGRVIESLRFSEAP